MYSWSLGDKLLQAIYYNDMKWIRMCLWKVKVVQLYKQWSSHVIYIYNVHCTCIIYIVYGYGYCIKCIGCSPREILPDRLLAQTLCSNEMEWTKVNSWKTKHNLYKFKSFYIYHKYYIKRFVYSPLEILPDELFA